MRGSGSCEEQPLGDSREEQPLTGSCEEKPLRGSCEEQPLTGSCEEQPLIDSCELQLCFGNCKLQLLFGSCKRWQLRDGASWQESSLIEDSYSIFFFSIPKDNILFPFISKWASYQCMDFCD
jgi:hypothetical protein